MRRWRTIATAYRALWTPRLGRLAIGSVDAELNFASAEELAALIHERKRSPAELMDHTLARVAELNPRVGALWRWTRSGPRHRDDLVLEVSCTYERQRLWNDRWPAI